MANLRDAEDLAAAVSALVGPGDVVVVADPVDPEVLAAILASGAAYVDAGRDHRFHIDAGGWRHALAADAARLAYLPSPSWPTGTRPDPQRRAEALAAGLAVLEDTRRDGEQWVWARVPGRPSAETAAAAADPRVLGSSRWTWRDGIVVQGPDPAAILRDLGAEAC